MRKWMLAVFATIMAVSASQAHFIWIVPAKDIAHVYFCDLPEADSPKLLDKIAHTKVFARNADGKTAAIDMKRGKQSFELALPGDRTGVLLASCHYGVLHKPNTEPFLLMYYAKAFLPKTDMAAQGAINKQLPLEIVRSADKNGGVFQVIWQGKPLAGAEVVVIAPGDDLPQTLKSDQNGQIAIGQLKSGSYGLRARHVEERAGTDNGKEYKQVRHYSTLAFEQ